MPSNEPNEEEDNSDDIIPSILNGSPFKIRPDQEKLTILTSGRPLPKLNIMKRDISKNCNRTFQSSWYGIHRWLCGSKSYNKLFCWPCTLMRPETSTWCSIGSDDVKRFSSLAAKHAICKSHIKAISEYDDTLTGFNLPPEFVNELNFKCKEEENETDQSDAEDEESDLFFKNDSKRKKSNDSISLNNQSTANTESKHSLVSKHKTKITFKTWQEMSKDNFPISTSKFYEEYKMYKWKRKLAKQELRNARLLGEKIKYEIDALKAKGDYYKTLLETSGKPEEAFENCLEITSQVETPLLQQ